MYRGGYVAGLASDPIEKKPFFHVYPGSKTMSFGMVGCDFHCDFCQNWTSSQTLRDPNAVVPIEAITPQQIVELTHLQHARIITSTYNEPLITSEWAVEIFKLGKKDGLKGAVVSNGNATPEVLDYLRPYVDFFKVDLKSFDPKHYQTMGGKLEIVLKTIELLKEKGFWVEIVTLLIPGFNDSEKELRHLTKFIASVSADIPWHVTAFHKDYQRFENENTTADMLIHACQIGQQEGLHYCYAGNLPGEEGTWENTRCPGCSETLIERYGYKILQNHMVNNKCPKCRRVIPGVWK